MEREKEKGVILGVLLLIPIVLSQYIIICYPEYFKGDAATRPLRSLFFFYIGLMFLASYYFSYKTFAFRIFRWICEYFSYPRSRKMAFFYFALCFFAGILSILDDLNVI